MISGFIGGKKKVKFSSSRIDENVKLVDKLRTQELYHDEAVNCKPLQIMHNDRRLIHDE